MWTYTSHSLGHVPRSRITELHGNSVFKTGRNPWTVFQIGGTILHFHQQCMRVLMFLYPRQSLFLLLLFNFYNHLVFVTEKAMAPHSSTLAWKTSWTGEPGRLQSMGLLSQTRVSNFTFTFHFHALEKEMATHSSVLAWRIPGTGEPDGLQSMESHRVGHDWSDLAAAAVFVNSHLTEALIRISLMTSPVEHLFRCLLDICRSFLERLLFISFTFLLTRQNFDLYMTGHCRHLIHIYLLNWISKRMSQYINFYILALIIRKSK